MPKFEDKFARFKASQRDPKTITNRKLDSQIAKILQFSENLKSLE
jgi:hypothetical protein